MKSFLHFLNNLRLFLEITFSKVTSGRKFKFALKKKAVKSAEQLREERKLFHSMLKAGDQYRLGSAIVTLAKFGVEGKEEVRQKLEMYAQRRAERAEKHRQRAIEIMLMPPEELTQFQIKEWLAKREEFRKKLLEFENASDEPPENKPNVRIK